MGGFPSLKQSRTTGRHPSTGEKGTTLITVVTDRDIRDVRRTDRRQQKVTLTPSRLQMDVYLHSQKAIPSTVHPHFLLSRQCQPTRFNISHMQINKVRQRCELFCIIKKFFNGNCLPTFRDNISLPFSRVENSKESLHISRRFV